MSEVTAAELDAFVALTHRMCDASGEVILRYYREPVEVVDKADKGPGVYSPVTKADQGSEKAIRELINTTFPAHGIKGEEYGDENLDAEYVWVLDPIDGTKAFITGFTSWGTLIALLRNGEPVLGAMNQPFIGDRFIGLPGQTTLNGNAIKARACKKFEQATLGITEESMMKTEAQRSAYKKIADQVGYLRLGGDCYNYALLAAGFIDLVIEGDLMAWDIQALIPIVEGAGGVITLWDGAPVRAGGWVVAAGDAELHAQAIDILKDAAPG
ncbi:MAG: histidinol-phosphatase [Rhodospirillaceae bacterium]|nr:histidinol-phosphatase [Rhodospirillaceae bacterium]MBT6828100.1 histidinol-phosphatase [Rhodospirillaceae bacterium]MBT7291080.1 histidinol-phosphatase [Rhodospirillaceae bacterium]